MDEKHKQWLEIFYFSCLVSQHYKALCVLTFIFYAAGGELKTQQQRKREQV